MADSELKISPRYEFDAPQFYDFSEGAPASPEGADNWFHDRVPSPASATKHKDCTLKVVEMGSKELDLDSRQPKAGIETCEQQSSGLGDTVVQQAATGHPLRSIVKGISNIVTSWGAPASRVLASQQPPSCPPEGPLVEEVSVPMLALPKREGFITPRRPKPTEQAKPSFDSQEPCPALDFTEQSQPQSKAASCAQEDQSGLDKPGRKVNSTKQATVRRQDTGQTSPKGQIDHQQKSSLPPKSAKSKASHLHQESEADQRPAKRSRTANNCSGAPDLATSARARPPRYKSRQQIEEEEMAARPRFKARPYSGSKIVQNAGPIWERAKPSHPAGVEGEHPVEKSSFKALRLDARILTRPDFEPKLEGRMCTLPQSPCLATSGRARSQDLQTKKPTASEASEEKKRKTEWQAGVLTDVRPFNFETENRSEVARATRGVAKKRKLEEVKEVPEFKALPVPLSHYHVPLAHTSNPVLTMPEPFSLESERRHHEAQVLKEMLNQQAEERERSNRVFKAKPVPKSSSQLPPAPAPSEKLLTIPEPFALPGDTRQVNRAAFDAEMHQRELLRQAQEESEAARRAEEEAQEVAKLRRSLEFKARPMPKYPSPGKTGFHPPPFRWTEPQSPQLETAKRARQKN